MKLGEIIKGLNNSTGMLGEQIGGNNFYDLFNKSMGMAGLAIGNNSGLQNILTTTLGIPSGLMNLTNIQKEFVGVGSNNWLGSNSALQSIGIGLPNNFFAANKFYQNSILGASETYFGKATGPESLSYRLLGASGLATGNNSILSSLTNILGTQHNILNQLTQLKPFGYENEHLTQYKNIFNTMGSLSAKLAAQGFTTHSSDESFKYVEDVTNEAAAITNTVVNQQYATAADIEKLYSLVNSIKDKFDSTDKSEFKTIGFWIGVLALFLSLYPIIQQKINNTGSNISCATKEQIIDLKNGLKASFHNTINSFIPTRLTNRRCNLYIKPRFKSCLLLTIPANEKLSVINTKGKWALVISLDKDSLPVTGWILKKYLVKSIHTKH